MTEEPTKRGFDERVREFAAASRTGEARGARRGVDRDRDRNPRALLVRARSIIAGAVAKLRARYARVSR